jgi:hypothetical protein
VTYSPSVPITGCTVVPGCERRFRISLAAPLAWTGRYSLSAVDETVGQFTLGLVSLVATGAAVTGITASQTPKRLLGNNF